MSTKNTSTPNCADIHLSIIFHNKVRSVADLANVVIKGFSELERDKANEYLNALESHLLSCLGDICTERQTME